MVLVYIKDKEYLVVVGLPEIKLIISLNHNSLVYYINYTTRKMKRVFTVSVLCTLLPMLFLCSATELEFSYDEQDIWPGICVTGNTGMHCSNCLDLVITLL